MRYDEGRKLALVTASARGLLHVPVCQMGNVDGRLGFAAERDLATFAKWLAQAQPLPKPLPSEEEAGSSRRVRFPRTPVAHLAALLI